MKTKRKIIYIGIGVIAVILLIPMVVGLFIYQDLKDDVFKVSSGSMSPIMQPDEYVEVDKFFPFEDIVVGDIIVFHPNDKPESLVIHRVATIIMDEPKTIRTKGDANINSIPGRDFPITEEQYVGKVFRIYPDRASVISGEDVRYP